MNIEGEGVPQIERSFMVILLPCYRCKAPRVREVKHPSRRDDVVAYQCEACGAIYLDVTWSWDLDQSVAYIYACEEDPDFKKKVLGAPPENAAQVAKELLDSGMNPVKDRVMIGLKR